MLRITEIQPSIAINEIVQKIGYDNPQTLLVDWSLMLALAKITQYQAECEFFAHKYRMSYKEFADNLTKQRHYEDFEQEADSEDWEFALQALRWWQVKLESLQNAVQYA